MDQKIENVYSIESAKKYLSAFSIVVKDDYQVNWHHRIIAQRLERALERVENGEDVRIIINMPPRHGKSELVTKNFPAWVLGKHPDWPVLCGSYNLDIAAKFGLKTRDLMENQKYQTIFKTRLRRDQKAKSNWLTEQDGGYSAAGIGTGITGTGFKIGIIDDPIKDRKEAESEIIRDTVWEWYKDVFYTRQEGGTLIVVVVTRWHIDDLVGRLIEKEEKDHAAGEEVFDQWEIICFPAFAEENERNRDVGDPLWPGKFNTDKLNRIKNTLSDYGWYSLYQQDPLPSETQEFMKDWFKYYNESELRLIEDLQYYTLVDLGHSEKKAGKTEPDRTVVRTVAKAPHLPQWYLISESAGVFNPGQTVDAVFKHFEDHGGTVWIEGVGYQKSIKYWIEERMRKDEVYFHVNILKANNETSKEERIRGLIPLYKAKVILHRDTGEDAALEKEALSFPRGKKDDRIDALANGLEAIKGTIRSKVARAAQRLRQQKIRRGKLINKPHRPLSKRLGG